MADDRDPSPRSGSHAAGVGGQPLDLTSRLTLRRRSDRRRAWLPVAAAFLALVVALGALYLVRYSPAFRVSTVDVTGTRVTSPAAVRAAAQVPEGRPLAAIDTAAIAQRVAALAPVKTVHVGRRWPHTITIEVIERTAAYQRLADGRYQWVDAQGVVFAAVAKPTAGLATVTTASVSNRLLADVATALAPLSAAERTLLRSVDATTPDRIELRLTDGRTVMWGSAAQSDLKAQVLGALLKVKARHYDVSSPSNPTSR